MKARHKPSGDIGSASRFNISSLSEVFFYGTDWTDTCFMRDIEVWVDGTWKDLAAAFKDRDVITDNYNTRFFEPANEEDRKRGYTLS